MQNRNMLVKIIIWKNYHKWNILMESLNNLICDSIGLYTVSKEKSKNSIKIFHLSTKDIDEIDKKMKVSE